MKAINELLTKKCKLESEVRSLSNGNARVGIRTNTIEIDTTGMSKEDERVLFHNAQQTAENFVRRTIDVKAKELFKVNNVLEQVEKLLEANS